MDQVEIQAAQARVDEIKWFHSFDFGNNISARGAKPLELVRAEAECYFGNLDLNGRSVLDIGAWNGYMSIDAEKRGASRVLATDEFAWLHPEIKGRPGFELARSLSGSLIEDRYINVPDVNPKNLGTFDVVLFLGVFYHLFDAPTLTKQISQCASELLIIETHQDALDSSRPAMVFYPGSILNNDDTNWWGPNPQCMYEMLKECGFARVFYVDNPVEQTRNPDSPAFRARGVYQAFRGNSSLLKLKVDPTGWWDLADPAARAEIFAPLSPR